MKKGIALVVAAILGLVGLVWIFQGIGVIKGSFMTGDISWTFIGIGVVLVAGGLFWFTNRPASRPR